MNQKQILEQDIENTILLVNQKETWGSLKSPGEWDQLEGHRFCNFINSKGKKCGKPVLHGRHWFELLRYVCECGLKTSTKREMRNHLYQVKKGTWIERVPGHEICPKCYCFSGHGRHIIKKVTSKVMGFVYTNHILRYTCECGFQSRNKREFRKHLKAVANADSTPIFKYEQKELIDF